MAYYYNSSSSSSSTGVAVDDSSVLNQLTPTESALLIALTGVIGLPCLVLSLIQLSLDYGWTCCGKYDRRARPAALKLFFHWSWLQLAIIVPSCTLAGQSDIASLMINQSLAGACDGWGLWLMSCAQAVCQMTKAPPPRRRIRITYALLIMCHTITLLLDVLPMIVTISGAYTLKIAFVLIVIIVGELGTVSSYRLLAHQLSRVSHDSLTLTLTSLESPKLGATTPLAANGGNGGLASPVGSGSGAFTLSVPLGTGHRPGVMMLNGSTSRPTTPRSSNPTTDVSGTTPAVATATPAAPVVSTTTTINPTAGVNGIRRTLRRIQILAMAGCGAIFLFLILMALLVSFGAQRQSIAVALLVILVWSCGAIGIGLVGWLPLQLPSAIRRVVYGVRPTATVVAQYSTGYTGSTSMGKPSAGDDNPNSGRSSPHGSGNASAHRARLLSPGRAAATADVAWPLPGGSGKSTAAWRDEVQKHITRRIAD